MLRIAAILSMSVALAFVAAPVFAQEAPDALVKRVSQEVVQIIKSDPLVQAGNEARISSFSASTSWWLRVCS